MRYLVYGAGAVGSLIGTRLALSGHPVTFLARLHAVQMLRSSGLVIESMGTSQRLTNPLVASDLNEALAFGQPDVILLTVKAYDCLTAAQDLRARMPEQKPLVSFLNGVGNENTLASSLGDEHIIGATLTSAVQSIQPGVYRVERERGIGLCSQHVIAAPLCQELTAAGFKLRTYRQCERMKWSKLLTNIVSNATSAILGWMPADVYRHAGLFHLEIEALREVVRVMRFKGFSPQNLPGVPVGLLGRALSLPEYVLRPILRKVVARGRGDKMPSFYNDLEQGRSEISWLNGAVVKEGAAGAIPTPANRVLTDTMQLLLHNPQIRHRFHHHPEMLLGRAREAGVPGM